MTRDQLVLAALAASGGAPLTPVQAQKLFFLIDKKIPHLIGGAQFNFCPDDYGPFDAAVYRSLESLARSGAVLIEAVYDLRRRTFRTTPAGQLEGESLLNSIDSRVADYIRTLSSWVRSQSFAQLVSAIYSEYPDMAANSIFRTRQ